ncbi:LytTR family transcriptional regulator [Marivirga sp. S37H4]|uniref:LytTR family transcriptional regulator n=1 Tax=Marivirga aurantiaca TaxID=2802615 RepID=A0A935C7T0_9BACT|nr:LytTR family DNA-binding domain-containing protein [Marivirga aurantiaca]MBK6265105.1 LytTR family transcriptional regulator [Marivirga aurantiaca]
MDSQKGGIIMAHSIVQGSVPEIKANTNKMLIGLSVAFLFIGGLTILQDLAESYRSGYAFYFSESLLFKTIWLLFIPILTILHHRLERENLESLRKITLYIAAPIVIHFLLVPFIAFGFSGLFFEGRYGLYKFFSYTLAHDFYKLVIIYAGFVLSYKFFQKDSTISASVQENAVLNKMIINNGKDNTIVCVEDILQITSASPYVFIHLENKKHLHSETLKSICQQLDSNIFIRVHKSTMVNVAKVQSFKSRLNGDYDLLLKNGDTVRLSRTYAANFKKHFKTSPYNSKEKH